MELRREGRCWLSVFKNERRASKRALLPLIIMASVFVLPSYRSCSEGPLHSPAHFAMDDVGSAAWIAPPFLVAALLAILTARALKKREVDLTTRRLGLFAVMALAVSSLTTAVFSLRVLDSVKTAPFVVVAAGAIGGAVLLMRRAKGRPGFQIWEHVLAAFALVVATAGPALLFGGELFFGNHALLGPGAWLYVGALAALTTPRR
jgi:hypothetical protein